MTEIARALERVADLYGKGLMDDDEFALAKAGILAAPAAPCSGGADLRPIPPPWYISALGAQPPARQPPGVLNSGRRPALGFLFGGS